MISTATWSELDKALLQAFIIENSAFGSTTHKVWRQRDITTAHWTRLIQIAERGGPVGSSRVVAWQDHEHTWHPLVDIEPSTLAELIYTC
ncbi:hypothetical protein [Amycolatopsis sp. TNS106]|uniref:hypothetical protein n=1 Tax=Amycolatopsis sp. TNS106 TaxID=2861750 RepID=UPI001C594A25|nr:hypothetical protein [Amycolatopsis sp. TNS106]QXV57431.1 hypothetical protein CVV72_10810 [Amycolatopsis sp. TNS106]